PVTHPDRATPDPDRWHRLSEQIVRDLDDSSGSVVAPPMIGTHQLAVGDRPEGKLDLAMRAPVLQCREPTVRAAVAGDRRVPERHLHDPARFYTGIVLYCVPVVRVHAGCARLLAAVSSFGKRRRASVRTRRGTGLYAGGVTRDHDSPSSPHPACRRTGAP